MGTWPRHAVLATISFIVVASSTLGTPPSGAALAQSDEPADIREVMLDEIGGLDLTDETTEQVGTFTRQFTGAAGDLRITGFAVTTPPGAQALFAASPTIDGLEFIEHPSLASARWVVPTGTAPGENGRSVLNFATRDHIFTIVFDATDPSFDGPGAVEAVARAQMEKAGPPSDTAAETPATETPDANTPDAGTPTELEARLSAMIPEQPPAGYGLDVAFVRLPGFSRLENDATADSGVVSFLNDRARGFTAAWKGAGLSAGVGISKYPYEIFAASDLAQFGKLPAGDDPRRRTRAAAPMPWCSSATRTDRVGVAFRRGDVLVLVLADYVAPATAEHGDIVRHRGGQPRRSRGAGRRDDAVQAPHATVEVHRSRADRRGRRRRCRRRHVRRPAARSTGPPRMVDRPHPGCVARSASWHRTRPARRRRRGAPPPRRRRGGGPARHDRRRSRRARR